MGRYEELKANSRLFIKKYAVARKSPCSLKDYVVMEKLLSNSIRPIVFKYFKELPYHYFLRTKYWKVIIAKKKSDVLFRCQLCNDKARLQLHHRSYKHRGAEAYNLQDLTVLCRSCHQKHHDITPGA